MIIVKTKAVSELQTGVVVSKGANYRPFHKRFVDNAKLKAYCSLAHKSKERGIKWKR